MKNTISITLENCTGFEVPKKMMKLSYVVESDSTKNGKRKIKCSEMDIEIFPGAFDIDDHYKHKTLLERLHQPSGDIVYLSYNEGDTEVFLYPPWDGGDGSDKYFYSNTYQDSKLLGNLIINIKP